MARIIPDDFDVFNELIDPNEQIVRDILKVKVNNWAKFRYSIYAGNSSDVLESSTPISDDVRKAFIELAKSHYEVVNSIGYVKLSLNNILTIDKSASDYFFKSFKWFKEFYIHIGSVLDNLARLIYILNSPDSATATKKNSNKLIRHWIDWNDLKRDYSFSQYNIFTQDSTLGEILNIRNNCIHNWRAPFILPQPTDGNIFLPERIRTDRNYLWPYEEINDLQNQYTSYISVSNMLNKDFLFVEDCQDKIFELLIADLVTFENNYNVKIREQWVIASISPEDTEDKMNKPFLVVPGGGSDPIGFANSSASIPIPSKKTNSLY